MMILNFDQRIAERSEGFIGRTWVFEAIDDWLEDSSGERFFLIQAEPGSGKSAIAAQLVQFNRAGVSPPDSCPHLTPGFLSAIHFCARTDSTHLDPLAFVNSVAMQLAERFPEFRAALVDSGGNRAIQVEQNVEVVNEHGQVIGVQIGNIERLELSGLSAENAFTLTIATPLLKLAAQGFNAPIIILVDSLDESLLYTGTPKITTLLQRLGSLPDNLRLICTTRPQTSITEPLVGQMCRLELNAPEFRDDINADIVAYAERALSQYPQLTTNIPRSQLIERIQELADGNFLYLSQLLPLMAQIEDMDVSDLNEIEPGLDPLYRSYLSDFQANWQTVGAIFGTLAVARAPLTVRQLQDITGQTGARSVLAAVRPLLETDDEIPASQRTYALYHRSFADFLLDEDDAELYWRDPVEQHQRIADYYTNEFAGYWDDADDYGLRYVVTHLGLATLERRNSAPGTRQLLDLLQTGSFVTVRARFDDFAGLQSDFQLALQCAVRGRRPEMLPLVVQASRGYLRFRQRALDPATIFAFAQEGNVEAQCGG